MSSSTSWCLATHTMHITSRRWVPSPVHRAQNLPTAQVAAFRAEEAGVKPAVEVRHTLRHG